QCKTNMHDLLVHNARIHPLSDDIAASAATTLAVDDGRITALGVPDDTPSRIRIDAGGRALLPGFIDCHTHAVYAGDRMAEHAMRLAGASYAEIAEAGGGIMTTVRATRAASETELVRASLPRVRALLDEGVT